MSLLPLPLPARALGDTSLRISPMAWGMWRLVDGGHGADDAARLIHTALDAGITLMDTADIYGFNGKSGFGDAERVLGEVLRAEPALRDRMVLSTKGGIRPPLPYDQSAGWLNEAIDASLTRLGVESIDLWHIHRPDILAHPQEVARTLDAAVAAGKIRALGVSNFTVAQIAALNHFLETKLVVTQPEISPLRLTCLENGEMDQAMMLGLTPLAWSPLGGGRLADPQTVREKAVATALDVVALDKGVSRMVAAYSWLMAHPAGIVPIIGSQSPARIIEGASACAVQWSRAQWYDVLIAARGEALP
jgi:predicted oxidoreductase